MDEDKRSNTTAHFVIFEEEIKKIKEMALVDKRNNSIENISIGYHEDTYCSWFPYAIAKLKNDKIRINPYVNQKHYHVIMTFQYERRRTCKNNKWFWKNMPDTNDSDCPKIIRKFRRIASKRHSKNKSTTRKHIEIIKNTKKLYDVLYKSCDNICSIP